MKELFYNFLQSRKVSRAFSKYVFYDNFYFFLFFTSQSCLSLWLFVLVLLILASFVPRDFFYKILYFLSFLFSYFHFFHIFTSCAFMCFSCFIYEANVHYCACTINQMCYIPVYGRMTNHLLF